MTENGNIGKPLIYQGIYVSYLSLNQMIWIR